MKKKHNPRSEAAQKNAIGKLGQPGISVNSPMNSGWASVNDKLKPTEIAIVDDYKDEDKWILAIFDIRDCYRKRQPLMGINKALKKAIRPTSTLKRRKV